jgi:cytoskeletal protein RodZ
MSVEAPVPVSGSEAQPSLTYASLKDEETSEVQTKDEPFDADVESDSDVEDENKPPSKPWIFLTIVLAILILCFVIVLILIYIGHLRPLSGETSSDDNTMKSINPSSAGVSGHPSAKQSNSIAGAASSILGLNPEHVIRDEHSTPVSASENEPAGNNAAASSGGGTGSLHASLKRRFQASDVAKHAPVVVKDEEDELDDAPGLAAFLGLRFHHHHDHEHAQDGEHK